MVLGLALLGPQMSWPVPSGFLWLSSSDTSKHTLWITPKAAGQSCNLSFFYFKNMAREPTGAVGSQSHSHPKSLAAIG